MTAFDDYDSIEIRTTLSRETNHEDDLEEWEERSGYQWESWEEVFKGDAEISQIIDDSIRQYDHQDDYIQLNKTTISWHGKDVECNLAAYDKYALSVPLLAMIWERDGALVDTYSGDDAQELERRYKAYQGTH